MNLRSLRFRHLEILKSLGDEGTVHATALKLHLSQPAVSKIVSEIEKRCGAQLFVRSRSGMEPNRFGIAMIRKANLLLNELDSTIDELAAIQLEGTALLRIGTLPLTGMLTVLKAVTTLRQELPRPQVRIIEGTVTELLHQLQAGQIDCFVGGLSAETLRSHVVSDLAIEPLCDDQLQVVTSPKNPIAKNKKIKWKDLLNNRWALPPSNGLLRQAFILAHIREGLTPPKAEIECQSSITVRLLCQLDPSILGILRSEAAHHENSLGLLRTIPVSPVAILPPLSLISRQRVVQNNPVVSRFIEALRRHANNTHVLPPDRT